MLLNQNGGTIMFYSSRTVQSATNSELSNASPLRNKAKILTALMLASSINAAAAAAAAAASSDIAHNRYADQIAYARELCSGVIGLDPGDEHFNGCVSSLADSIHSADSEHAVIQARSQCF